MPSSWSPTDVEFRASGKGGGGIAVPPELESGRNRIYRAFHPTLSTAPPSCCYAQWIPIGHSAFYRWIPRATDLKAMLLPRSCRRCCGPLRRRSLRSWLPRHRRCAKQRLTRRLSEGTRRGAEDGREEEKKKKEDRRVSLLLSRRAAARHTTCVQRRSAVSSVCAVFGRLIRKGQPTFILFDVPFCNRPPRSRAAARSRA